MDNPFLILMSQPALFEDIDETAHGAIELFPAVWGAVEDLASPEAALRHQALDKLEDLDAPRLSPLVAYMITTRLTDPDISFRQRAIKVLGRVLTPDEQGRLPTDAIIRCLNSYLSQMRTRSVYALLEAAAGSPTLAPYAARLFNACPFAGNHLGDILSNRKMPLEIRKQAAYFLGEVGFLDSIPVLERLESRLASRLKGQQSMSFAPPSAGDEIELMPDVQRALLYLRSI
jgi:HEAT repeat protein